MLSIITPATARRALLASAVAFTWFLAAPLLPSGLSAEAPTIGAAFARRGADDGPNHDLNDDHRGKHHGRHGKNDDHRGKHHDSHDDDGPNHDRDDDHPGKHNDRK